MKKLVFSLIAGCCIVMVETPVQAIVRASTVDLIVNIRRGNAQAVHDAIEGGVLLNDQIGNQKLSPLMIAIKELGKSLEARFNFRSENHKLRLEIVKNLIRASSIETIELKNEEGKTALEMLYTYALELGTSSSYYSDMLKQVELLIAHKTDANEQRI